MKPCSNVRRAASVPAFAVLTKAINNAEGVCFCYVEVKIVIHPVHDHDVIASFVYTFHALPPPLKRQIVVIAYHGKIIHAALRVGGLWGILRGFCLLHMVGGLLLVGGRALTVLTL